MSINMNVEHTLERTLCVGSEAFESLNTWNTGEREEMNVAFRVTSH